jgi:hypothetical protein
MGYAEWVHSLNSRDAMVFGNWLDRARGLILGVDAWELVGSNRGAESFRGRLSARVNMPRGMFQLAPGSVCGACSAGL